MRALIRFSSNSSLVPFDLHIPKIVGFLHRCIGGENALHDAVSLYSVGWLQGAQRRRDGLDFPGGAQLSFSAHDPSVLLQLIQGIQQDKRFAYGMLAEEVVLQAPPQVTEGMVRFAVSSPVLVRKKVNFEELPEHIRANMEAHGEPPEKAIKYLTYEDGDEADAILTNVFHTKLEQAGLSTEGASVSFCHDYKKPRVKLVNYKGTKSKASLCPVVVRGSAEQIKFFWLTGVGFGTGIGMGALR